jgi:hypothetical protein
METGSPGLKQLPGMGLTRVLVVQRRGGLVAEVRDKGNREQVQGVEEQLIVSPTLEQTVHVRDQDPGLTPEIIEALAVAEPGEDQAKEGRVAPEPVPEGMDSEAGRLAVLRLVF